MAKVGNLERMQEEEEQEELPFVMDTDIVAATAGDSDGKSGTDDGSFLPPSSTANNADMTRLRRSASTLGGGGDDTSSSGGGDGGSRSGGGYYDESEAFFRGRSLTVDSAITSGGGATPLSISRSRRYLKESRARVFGHLVA
jgi:hypothetical protein